MKTEIVKLTQEELQQAILQAARWKLIAQGKAVMTDTLAGDVKILGVWSIISTDEHVVEIHVTYLNPEGSA